MKKIIKMFSFALILMCGITLFACGKEKQTTLEFVTKEGSAINLVVNKEQEDGVRAVKYNDENVGVLHVKSKISKDDKSTVTLDKEVANNEVAFSLELNKSFIAMPIDGGKYKRIKFCIDNDSNCYYIFYTCQNVANSKITATEDDSKVTYNFTYSLGEEVKNYTVYLVMGTDVSVIL